MDEPTAAIARIVRTELRGSAPPAVEAVARRVASRHKPGVVAVLFYGSCFRDRIVEDRLVDLYLIVDCYRRAYGNPFSVWMNRLVPPNVYYAEAHFEGAVVRAKYSILSLDHLERLVRPETHNPYFWGRFAQPTGLAFAVQPDIEERIVAALEQAIKTMLEAARSLKPAEPDTLALWRQGFEATYGTELRAEKPHRAAEIVECYADRYRRLAELTGRPQRNAAPANLGENWRWRRVEGKLLSVLRLIKAAFTFKGGADYLAWKIERHSGVSIELAPWQRRHPILAAPPILWRLWRAKAVR